MKIDEIKMAVTEDLHKELKRTKRALGDAREAYIKIKRHIIELENKQTAVQDELDGRIQP